MTSVPMILAALVGIAAFLTLALWRVIGGESRAQQMLDNWLADNDFQLLRKSTPWIKDNPFFLGSNRSQKVFKVVVRTPQGGVRTGWVRCGHALLGVAKDQVEVKWEKPNESRDHSPSPPN